MSHERTKVRAQRARSTVVQVWIFTSHASLSFVGSNGVSESWMSKKRLATVWLDGCSGCHMSFLDMDERLLAVAGAG